MGHMDITRHVAAIQSDLAAAAALGGDSIAEAGRKLSEAVESSLQLRLLDLLTEAALGLNSRLASGHIEVRLAGREPDLVYVDETPADADLSPSPCDDLSARITLRLPEGLKAGVESAADREGVSTNAWIVRALSRALEPRSGRRAGGHRLQGYAQS
jgi:HicB-like protein involved in pilus formation